MIENIRFELSFKDINQLKNKIEFCKSNRINKINIPCKGLIKKDFLLEVVNFIGQNYKDLDVIYHYSLYHQYYKNNIFSFDYFIEFIKKCSSYQNKEILVISGTNKKKNFESFNALEYLKKNYNSTMGFGVAYNPYIKKDNFPYEERERFKKKASSGLIKSVWLQFGTDIKLLEKEIKFLKEYISKNSFKFKNENVNIYGSLFIPSKQFLARFKFRPWKGVYLSNDYLNSLDFAKKFTKEIVEIYKLNNILPIIETECCSLKQLNNANYFLKL